MHAYLDKAYQIGLAIDSKRIEVENEVGWLSKASNQFDGIFSYMPLANDIYEGNIGIAFTYLYLYKYTKKTAFLDVVIKILNQSKQEFIFRESTSYFQTLENRFETPLNVSVLSFPLCSLYLMSHVSHVVSKKYWDNNYYRKMLSWIANNINNEISCDLLLGLSGTVLLLSNLYNDGVNNENETLDLINLASNKIINLGRIEGNMMSWPYIDNRDTQNPEKKLGGMAHGSAGIALALAQCYKLTKKPELKSAVIGAYNHDQSFYNETLRGWTDKRREGEFFDGGGWCHGSSGIGLSRLLLEELGFLSYSNVNQKKYDFFKKIALENSLKKTGFNQSLCHGDMGNIEIAACISKNIGDEVSYKTCIEKMNRLASIDPESFITGTEGQLIKVLGLFTGLAGVAYNFLRFYDFDAVPSVLAVESPLLTYNSLH